jgi:glycosyltransferase involved in cell wall biosynthesis
LQRLLTGRTKQWEFTRHSVELFAELRPDVVVAQFGPTGVRIMEACRLSGIPLIVNFRGADASTHRLINEHSAAYLELFKQASAIVAVSHSIERTLLSLGAPREKLFWNPSGADCDRFHGGDPAAAPPVFLGTGRFVEKKAPHLLILAFAEVHRRRGDARLRMIGDGPLIPFCRELVRHLQLDDAVEFLGVQPHERVVLEMRRTRAFAQHSIVAPSGDSEGTPVAVMEASASGLPVVATRHAGIPDVVIDGDTGFLVDEGDVFAMATCMLRLIDDPKLAQRMGRAGRARVEQQFSQQLSLQRIWSIIQQCHHTWTQADDGATHPNSRAA